MRKHLVPTAIALLAVFWSGDLSARLNPIRYLSDQVIRPEIVIVFDTSGSMLGDAPNGFSRVTGNDCSGHDANVDVCGDYLCSGHETTAGYASGTNCATDCHIYNHYTTAAGSPHKCNYQYTTTPTISRMNISKRAMQNVLADFRGVASFGLVTFDQTGYYRYFPVDGSASAQTVGLYLHQWELRSAGSWVGGAGWDETNNVPATSFTVNGVTYTLNGGAAGNSLYRRIADAPTATPAWKGWSGCSWWAPCGWGEGDCDSNSECQPGLVCGTDNGPKYFDGTEGYNYSPYSLAQLDICEPPPGSSAAASYEYTRVDWAGFRYNDGSNDWEYMGSYYTYTAHAPDMTGTIASPTWLGWSGCSAASPCAEGGGDCDSDAECQAGLSCVDNVGLTYFSPTTLGLSITDVQTIDLCGYPNGARTLTTFYGPEYVDGGGTRWVYHRYGDNRNQSSYDVTNAVGDGMVKVSMLEATESTTQADYDKTLGEILNKMNMAQVGGIEGGGGTPTCAALRKAKDHFDDRIAGTGSFSAVDFAGSCRPRFVLVISDGESSPDCSANGAGGAMATDVKSLYNIGVKSYAVTIPGISSSGRAEMDLVADLGDDGVRNYSAEALYSNNEKELVDNIRRVLFDAIKGQYTTTSAGVASSGSATIQGDLAVIPSTEFPGWYGHLRTVDLTKSQTDEGYELWDAGDLLAAKRWQDRRIYTGAYDVNSGSSIPLLATDGTGTVNLSGGCTGCGTNGVKSVWPGTPPSDAQITAALRWLAGLDRTWKLGAIIRSVPATVGPPPTRPDLTDHGPYETTYMTRQKLVYVGSNEGVIHAFDVATGQEVFAFVPPVLLPKIYDLYQSNGQSDNPAQIEYLLTSSPRVGDFKDSTLGWRTYLVQTFGVGADAFVSLDITSPTSCSDPSDTTTCSATSDPVRVVFSSERASPSVDAYLGETWSIPTMFWNSGLVSRVAMASGYDVSSGDGRWYNLFTDVGSNWDTGSTYFGSFEHTVGLAEVRPFAVVANTIAVTETTGVSEVLATYQVDPLGRMYRFDDGLAASAAASLLVDVGATQPFVLPPAGLRRDTSDQVTLAFVSGAYQELDIGIGSSSVTFQHTGTTFEPRLYLRTENAGSVTSNDNLTCPVGDLCNASCYSGGSVPSGCTGPSARALPVSQPLIVTNKAYGDRAEAFFLVYDPPAQACSGAAVATGDSWIIRIAMDPGGSSQDLVQAKKYANTQASGLVIVGGGQDVALSVTGRGSQKAGAVTLSGLPIDPNTGTTPVHIEGWREVR